MSDEPVFFVVRPGMRGERYALEFGDFSLRYTKDEKASMIYRAELPPDYRPTLGEAVAAYKKGVRIKAPPRPKPVEAKTSNPIRERWLAQVRSLALPPERGVDS